MTNWPVKTLGEVCEVARGTSITRKQTNAGSIPVVAGGIDVAYFHSVPNRPAGTITVSSSGANAGFVNRWDVPIFASDCSTVVAKEEGSVLGDYAFRFLQFKQGFINAELRRGAAQPHVYAKDIAAIEIPVPPLDEQKRIVTLLDDATARITELTACYEKVCTHTKDLLESSLLELFADAFASHPKRKMGEVLQIARGGSPRPIGEYITKSPKGVNWIKIGDASASKKYIFETAERIRPEGVSRSRMVYPGDFLLSNSMSFGRPYIMKTEGCIHDGWLVLRDSKGELDQDFLFYLLGSRFMYERFSQLAAGSTVQNLNSSLVSSVEIPVPPLDLQKKIATKAIEIEEKVSRLTENFQLKLQAIDEMRQSILEAAFAGEL